ncbi:Hypothetical protein AA314_06860 [Archangium gephyra]|uniref:Uncharacterized protein n=1 Tax=Archangium gephyra TaxID=48 RepID=A0AAC8QD18_9BACT|nr:Hypothetical protein AA314_06860 [Archangium gephyra]
MALGLMTHPAPAVAAQAGAGGGDRSRKGEGVQLRGRGAHGGLLLASWWGRILPFAAGRPSKKQRKREHRAR